MVFHYFVSHLCYKRNGSWFGVAHEAMDALGKLRESTFFVRAIPTPRANHFGINITQKIIQCNELPYNVYATASEPNINHYNRVSYNTIMHCLKLY